MGVLRAALQAVPGGLRDTALTIKGGREGFSREWRAARRRVWPGPESRKSPVWSAERRASERTHGTRWCLGPASWALTYRVREHPSADRRSTPCFSGGHEQASEEHMPRENDDACSKSIRSSPRPAYARSSYGGVRVRRSASAQRREAGTQSGSRLDSRLRGNERRWGRPRIAFPVLRRHARTPSPAPVRTL